VISPHAGPSRLWESRKSLAAKRSRRSAAFFLFESNPRRGLQFFTTIAFALLLFLLKQIVLMFRPYHFPVLCAVILAHMTSPAHMQLTSR
jgi:hypothetical protein